MISCVQTLRSLSRNEIAFLIWGIERGRSRWELCRVILHKLRGNRGFGKACDLFVFAIFPFAEASKNINAFEALQDIARFG